MVRQGSLGLIGVAGADGKTTTAHLIEAILQDGCPPGALCSSEAQRIGEQVVTIDQLTEARVELRRFLARAHEVGAPWAVVEYEESVLLAPGQGEASAGAGGSVAKADIAVVTSGVSPMAERLVRGQQRSQTIVLNRDDPNVMQLAEGRHRPRLTFGQHAEADVRATEVETSLAGSQFLLRLPGAEPQSCHLQLLGEQNVANALAAAAVGHLLGLSPETIGRALCGCPGLPGRMERLEEGQPFHVVVDWADTPTRLAQVARFRPPGIERVLLLSENRDRLGAIRAAVAKARHGDLLLICGRPQGRIDERARIREVLVQPAVWYDERDCADLR
jgi:UDP-N-acetylmuramoyl-L-alanyl-D-glutamate--2,6-diaminopimelate ligase